jgi:hypothetical protein
MRDDFMTLVSLKVQRRSYIQIQNLLKPVEIGYIALSLKCWHLPDKLVLIEVRFEIVLEALRR